MTYSEERHEAQLLNDFYNQKEIDSKEESKRKILANKERYYKEKEVLKTRILAKERE